MYLDTQTEECFPMLAKKCFHMPKDVSDSSWIQAHTSNTQASCVYLPHILSVPLGWLDQDLRLLHHFHSWLQLPYRTPALLTLSSVCGSSSRYSSLLYPLNFHLENWILNPSLRLISGHFKCCHILGTTWLLLWHINFPKLFLSFSSPLIFWLCSLRLQKVPDQNCSLSTPCSGELMRHTGGKSADFKQALRLLPHAGNFTFCPISPLLALVGWVNMSVRLVRYI